MMGNFLPLLKIQVKVVRKISKDPWGSLSVERESGKREQPKYVTLVFSAEPK